MPLVDHVKKQIQMKNSFRCNKDQKFLLASNDCRKKLVNEVTASANVKTYIENLANDPVPHIRGIVDWNFNRGTLQLLEKNNQDFLVHVNNEKSVKLIKLHPKMEFTCEKSEQTANRFANELMIGNKFIGIRHKNSIRVANFSKTEKFKDGEVIEVCDFYDHQQVDEIIASAFFNDQLIVMDSNEYITKYDLNYKAVNYRYQFPFNTSNYVCRLPFSLSAVKETKIGIKVTYTNAQEFGFIDCRSTMKDKIMCIPFQDHFVMNCEKIFNHHHSQFHDYLTYIVSSHMLYCIDYRQPKQPLIQWAHQISEQPMMITSTSYADNEIICVSSNTPGDLKVFNFDGTCFNYLPLRPLSIQNSFNRLRKDGHFVTSNVMKERISMSTTGIALKADVGTLRTRLFTQNAAGDIFEGILACHEKTVVSDYIFKNFNEFHSAVSSNTNAKIYMPIEERLLKNEIVVDDVVRMDSIAKVLTCEILQCKDPEEDNFNMQTEIQPQWKMSIEKARSYQDVMAKEIMNIWDDLEIEEVKPSLFADALERTEQCRESSSDRVTRWLRASNAREVVIQEINFNDIVPLPIDNLTHIEIQASEESAKFETTIIQTDKKKKSRITGF